MTSMFPAAERGGEVLARVVRTLDEIRASSNKVVEVVGLIDGIAFQARRPDHSQ